MICYIHVAYKKRRNFHPPADLSYFTYSHLKTSNKFSFKEN